MPATFLYSDPHFGHQGVCNFLRADGITKLRPWDTAEEMDEAMVERYNERVKPNDKVYFLGDVVINRKALSILHRLNGDKILIKGNHDIFKLQDYTRHFRDIRSYQIMNGLIMSHIPLHPESLYRFGCNIHGHLHANRVMRVKHTGATPEIDPNYFNACVEQHDFAPVLFEDALEQIREQGGTVGFKDSKYGHGLSAT
jgi:calcineurin-like phosphoesterase family protein